MLSYKEYA